MYVVDFDDHVRQQVDTLPVEALTAFAELRVMLETAPWRGPPYREANPDGAVRMQAFGGRGQVMYLIMEEQRRVELLLVQWVG